MDVTTPQEMKTALAGVEIPAFFMALGIKPDVNSNPSMSPHDASPGIGLTTNRCLGIEENQDLSGGSFINSLIDLRKCIGSLIDFFFDRFQALW